MKGDTRSLDYSSVYNVSRLVSLNVCTLHAQFEDSAADSWKQMGRVASETQHPGIPMRFSQLHSPLQKKLPGVFSEVGAMANGQFQ